jgi:hypothetical protein
MAHVSCCGGRGAVSLLVCRTLCAIMGMIPRLPELHHAQDVYSVQNDCGSCCAVSMRLWTTLCYTDEAVTCAHHGVGICVCIAAHVAPKLPTGSQTGAYVCM